jgi:4-oxalocrotonate tautomerase family enzyme
VPTPAHVAGPLNGTSEYGQAVRTEQTATMPLLTIELMEGHGPDVHKELIEKCTALYAAALEAPPARIRMQIHAFPRDCWGLEGIQGNERVSPQITIEMMEGRPPELHLKLMKDLSELVAAILDIPISSTRVLLREFAPTHWAIGGVPASVARASEVAARNAAR